MISARNSVIRSKLTASNVLERIEKKSIQKESTETRNQRWKAKTKNSPYAVDLIADYPDLSETAKGNFDYRRAETTVINERRGKVNDASIVRVFHSLLVSRRHDLIFKSNVNIVSDSLFLYLKASDECSDLDFLRREKRAILKEELRLKTLLQIEKSNDTDRESRVMAERAERHRQQLKLQHRRSLYRNSLDAIIEEESSARRRKCGM